MHALAVSTVHRNNQGSNTPCAIIPRNAPSAVGTEKQMSSPDISEMVSVENIKNNALNNCTSYSNLDDKQKIVLLKIPNSENVSDLGWGFLLFRIFRIRDTSEPIVTQCTETIT